MNISEFFHSVRGSVFGGSLTKGQVDGMDKTIAYWQENYKGVSLDQFAYILATIAWETGRKMVPVKEAGSEAYLRSKKYYPYIGVGLVQVTWAANWRRFGIRSLEDGLSWPRALHACFEGMTKGMFTGKKLSDYIANGRRDYINARRIINGTDRAREVAAYAEAFRRALVAANYVTDPVIPPLPPAPAPAPDVAAFDHATFKAWLLEAIHEDEDVRAAVIALVFPDDGSELAEAYDPADEPHDDYGGDYQITDAVTQAEQRDANFG